MPDTVPCLTASEGAFAPGRRAAGEDPAKREQILDGAKRVFMQKGFDAASMNDITREAGVSKGTIYVYFENKEELFAALIEAERARIVASVKLALDVREPVEEALHDFGMAFVTGVTSDYTIRAMRTVLGVMDRMPNLALRFFSTGPENGFTVLKTYLERQREAGRLTIDDTALAAQQFMALSTAGTYKHRLFGVMEAPPAEEEVDRIVTSAVRVFMAAHRPGREGSAR
ncbi:TetR/AcrR family transcriptional regulator [Ensifer soli]|uniref:TetR/AcrR family transcriptional regulator n=1 Tax=Ciceribacter sp. sgz301302 TaxID=3342379 RepID=UPI0035B77460